MKPAIPTMAVVYVDGKPYMACRVTSFSTEHWTHSSILRVEGPIDPRVGDALESALAGIIRGEDCADVGP